MRDPVEAFIDAERLGILEQRIKLDGQLLHGEATLPANLCRTSRGLFVVGARDAAQGYVLDASSPPPRYVSGRFGDAIEVNGIRLGVPLGAKARVLEAIGISRLRRSSRRAAALRDGNRFVERLPGLYAWWLSAELAADEVVLAALITADVAALPSEVVEGARARPVFVMTDRRSLLVALSAAGDVRHVELPRESLQVLEAEGKVRISIGDQNWTSAKNNAGRLSELGAAAALPPAERLLEVARLNWLGAARDPERVAWSRYLLERAAQAGACVASFAQFLIAAELGESPGARPDLTGPLELLRDRAAPAAALAAAWTGFKLGLPAGRELLRALTPYALRAEPWSSELELAVQERTGSNGSERLELVARVAGQRGDTFRRLEAIRELACLDPLGPESLDRLLDAASGELLTRTRRVAELLDGPCAIRRDLPQAEPSPLPDELIEQALAHPLARDAGPVGRMQALLAVVPKPDVASLRDYVERLSPERDHGAHGALERAAGVLGFGRVEAFVSRGSKSVGVCGYEAAPPLVLIGSRHLDRSDEYAMSDAELGFALTCEVAHLRLGHARVTSSEVWAGALSRSRQGFDLVLGILPMLKGWALADRAQHLARKLPPDLLRQLGSRLGEMAAERRLEEAAKNSQVLSRLNEQLVRAHRTMQLSADRAGLLLVADPGVALRAMLLVRPDYRVWLDQVDRLGWRRALELVAATPSPELSDLRLRVSALFGFYLSKQYELLEREIWADHNMLDWSDAAAPQCPAR